MGEIQLRALRESLQHGYAVRTAAHHVIDELAKLTDAERDVVLRVVAAHFCLCCGKKQGGRSLCECWKQ